MKVYNIYEHEEANLGEFTDARGTITDIFYGKSIFSTNRWVLIFLIFRRWQRYKVSQPDHGRLSSAC